MSEVDVMGPSKNPVSMNSTEIFRWVRFGARSKTPLRVLGNSCKSGMGAKTARSCSCGPMLESNV